MSPLRLTACIALLALLSSFLCSSALGAGSLPEITKRLIREPTILHDANGVANPVHHHRRLQQATSCTSPVAIPGDGASPRTKAMALPLTDGRTLTMYWQSNNILRMDVSGTALINEVTLLAYVDGKLTTFTSFYQPIDVSKHANPALSADQLKNGFSLSVLNGTRFRYCNFKVKCYESVYVATDRCSFLAGSQPPVPTTCSSPMVPQTPTRNQFLNLPLKDGKNMTLSWLSGYILKVSVSDVSNGPGLNGVTLMAYIDGVLTNLSTPTGNWDVIDVTRHASPPLTLGQVFNGFSLSIPNDGGFAYCANDIICYGWVNVTAGGCAYLRGASDPVPYSCSGPKINAAPGAAPAGSEPLQLRLSDGSNLGVSWQSQSGRAPAIALSWYRNKAEPRQVSWNKLTAYVDGSPMLFYTGGSYLRGLTSLIDPTSQAIPVIGDTKIYRTGYSISIPPGAIYRDYCLNSTQPCQDLVVTVGGCVFLNPAPVTLPNGPSVAPAPGSSKASHVDEVATTR